MTIEFEDHTEVSAGTVLCRCEKMGWGTVSGWREERIGRKVSMISITVPHIPFEGVKVHSRNSRAVEQLKQERRELVRALGPPVAPQYSV